MRATNGSQGVFHEVFHRSRCLVEYGPYNPKQGRILVFSGELGNYNLYSCILHLVDLDWDPDRGNWYLRCLLRLGMRLLDQGILMRSILTLLCKNNKPL